MSGRLSYLEKASKGLGLLEMTEKERKLVAFVIGFGFRLRWKIYRSTTNYNASLALEMGWNETSVSKAVTALRKRGWLACNLDNQDIASIALTKKYLDACQVVIDRQAVRHAIGVYGCKKLDLTDDDADMITDYLKMERENYLTESMPRRSAHVKDLYDRMMHVYSSVDRLGQNGQSKTDELLIAVALLPIDT